MENLFRQLLEILYLQRETVELLSEISVQQNEALRANDLPALIALSPKQNRAVAAMSEYDKKREGLESELNQKLNLPPGTKLLELAHCAPENIRTELLELREDLKQKAEKMLEIVKINKYIMTQSAKLFDQLLKIFTVSQATTYAPSGQIREDRNLSTLDKQI